MEGRAQLRIAVVGMEELPALTARRLREAGYAGARALEGVRGPALLRALKPFDVFHAVYPTYYIKWLPALRAWGKKVVFHWVGSDVHELRRRRGRRFLFGAVRAAVDLHIADAPWLIEDLREMGVTAHLVPTISDKMTGGLIPMPPAFRLMAYLPPRRRDFYGWPVIAGIARALPAFEFIVVGGGAPPAAPGNVRAVGVVDGREIDRLYAEVSALVRPTEHDGLSQMVLEALLRGRQVVWSRRFPHCIYAATPAEFVAAAERLAASCPPNVAGARFVAENYSPAAAARALAAAYEQL